MSPSYRVAMGFGLLWGAFSLANAAGWTAEPDFDGDGRADLLWRHTESGESILWLSSDAWTRDHRLAAMPGWQLLAGADFNADGSRDLLWWQPEQGVLSVQLLVKGQPNDARRSMAPAPSWQFSAACDLNGDGRADILWRNRQTGDTALSLNTLAGFEIRALPVVADQDWQLAGCADQNGDGRDDMLWRHQRSGTNYQWLLNPDLSLTEQELLSVSLDWQLQALTDQDGDGTADLLWRHGLTGELYLFRLTEAGLVQQPVGFRVTDPNWQLQTVADHDGDGQADQLWRHALTGANYLLLTQGATLLGEQALLTVNPASGWQLASGRPLVPNKPLYRHGDSLTLQGDFGSNSIHKSFLGGAQGAIEAQAIGATMPNANGWRFSDLGFPTQVAQDAQRGKVLLTQQDSQHYNADRRYDPGFAIPERRHIYKAHYVRNRLQLNGQPFTNSYQWKHERINWENSIVDGWGEIKIHSWMGAEPDVLSFINRDQNDSSVFYGGQAAETNADWALMEILVYTGTQGQADGKLITRVFKNGQTYISENQQDVAIYANSNYRLRYFLEQNYFGNFSQTEAGVDNGLPKPDLRELYSDDSQVLIGLTEHSGWKRVELRDSLDPKQAKIRELQDWQQWEGAIQLQLNTGGLPSGTQDLYLVVIDGVDEQGWDRILASQPIRVQVP